MPISTVIPTFSPCRCMENVIPATDGPCYAAQTIPKALEHKSLGSPLGLVKCVTVVSWKMLTSSMPGIVFTPSLLRVFCSRLSSVDVVLWTAFFFLQRILSSVKQALDKPLEARVLLRVCITEAPADCSLAPCPDRAGHLFKLLPVHLQGCNV